MRLALEYAAAYCFLAALLNVVAYAIAYNPGEVFLITMALLNVTLLFTVIERMIRTIAPLAE